MTSLQLSFPSYLREYSPSNSNFTVQFQLTMSIAFAAQQANKLSAEFVKEIRSSTTSLLEFFARHQSTLMNNSNDENKKTLETDGSTKAVRNYLIIY